LRLRFPHFRKIVIFFQNRASYGRKNDTTTGKLIFGIMREQGDLTVHDEFDLKGALYASHGKNSQPHLTNLTHCFVVVLWHWWFS
jgi:hypothetical protein